ncbi:Fc receptor-like protein 5 [Heptranchias perlo]|uniref:Fc receptor-like protein 5 n=1 Tax=Heptranchias perlo TaxID=212740 RepID=UPI00355A02C1
MCRPCAFVLLLKLILQEAAQAESEAPLLTIDPPWVGFLTGDRITFKCEARRELRSTEYVWNINDQGDIPGNSNYIIGAAKKKDSGRYKCKVNSLITTRDASYSNTILVNITRPDSSVTFDVAPESLWVDQSLVLRCNFSFLLTIELIYTFYRKGFILSEIRTRNKSASFEVERVTLEHEGRYRCQVNFALYPYGLFYSSGYKSVSVRESPVRLEVRPKTQRDGDTIELRCLYTDSDRPGSPRYYFYRNNSPVNSDSAVSGLHRIQQATVMDSGWYHCAMHNNGVNYTSTRKEITVKRIAVSNVKLQISPGNGAMREGINLTLTCSVTEGSPPISYDWYRGEMYIHKEISSCRQVSYTIYHFNESIGGNYSCRASNKVEGKEFTLRSRAVKVIAEGKSHATAIRASVLTLFLIAAVIAMVSVNLPNNKQVNSSRSSQPLGEISGNRPLPLSEGKSADSSQNEAEESV